MGNILAQATRRKKVWKKLKVITRKERLSQIFRQYYHILGVCGEIFKRRSLRGLGYFVNAGILGKRRLALPLKRGHKFFKFLGFSPLKVPGFLTTPIRPVPLWGPILGEKIPPRIFFGIQCVFNLALKAPKGEMYPPLKKSQCSPGGMGGDNIFPRRQLPLPRRWGKPPSNRSV